MLAGLLAAVAATLQPGYVDPKLCAQCHPAISRQFSRTGMGRSFSKTPDPPSGRYYHRASNRHYEVFSRDGAHYLRRRQLDSEGKPVNILERRIDLVIGSGNHARTLVHRTEQGRLLMLPLTWYSAGGGYWAMSPGYDRADHLDFRREVSAECLFCHNGYPAASNGGTAEGIDCQRCHGPGERHVRRPERGTILHPGKLPPERELEICLQCHLETASQGIPNAIRRAGRGVFSYRPGEPLSDYVLQFDRAESGDRFEINHAAYRLRQSLCRPLSCTTCHNPHHAGPRTSYRETCQKCHQGEHGSAQSDCMACHMPKRRAEDAVHVVMTDHRIQRNRPAADLLAPRAEDHRPYQGRLIPYYPPDPGPLYGALAQILERNDLRDGIPLMLEAIESSPPKEGLFHAALAEAFRSQGRLEEAIPWYRRAMQKERGYAGKLGEALVRAGRPDEALPLLEKSGFSVPLAIAYGQLGRLEDSLRVLKAVLKDNPDAPLAWLNLAVTLERKQRWGEAEQAYREAIRLQPDLTEARRRLSLLHSHNN